MVCDQSTHLWLGRFCVQLMRLRQDASLGFAVRRAVTAFAHSRDLLPEDAARLDAAVLSSAQPPRPPQTIGWTTTKRRAYGHR